MDGSYRSDSPPPVCSGGYLRTSFSGGGLHEVVQPDRAAPPWTPPPTWDGGPWFGGPRFAQPYGFDPSVPPPGFGCPHTAHFAAPVKEYSGAGVTPFQSGAGPHTPRFDGEPSSDREVPPSRQEDDEARQRRQDAQWLIRFTQSRGRSSRRPQSQREPRSSFPALREALYGAAQLVSRLEEACGDLEDNLHHDAVWTHSYLKALDVKRELQDRVQILRHAHSLDELKVKVSRAARRRARRLRARKDRRMQEKHAEERSSHKEAAIDQWRMKQMQEVEEKKKERELKMAADSVLCEVRKKQADVKRMQDILRSLEKLRRLRNEAVFKKGIVTEPQSDEAFSRTLEQLRTVMKRRTVVYSAEEKALMVMLEGEQEEERRREQERRVRKERERQLQRRHRVDSMLFGEEFPADCTLQPFRDYYKQAEHTLHNLIQIRREWDVFVVAADHPDGSSVPQGWILPDPPSDQAWASALQTADTESL